MCLEIVTTVLAGEGLEAGHRSLFLGDRTNNLWRPKPAEDISESRNNRVLVASDSPLSRRLADLFPASVAVVALGALCLVASVANFLRELRAIESVLGPALAVVANVALSLGVVYAGYLIARSSLSPERRWTVAGWTVGGALVATAVVLYNIIIRNLEGRAVYESIFTLIVVGALGAVFGAAIGFKHENTRAKAAEIQEVRDAMAFTNNLLRHDVLNGLQVMRGHAEIVAAAEDERLAESGGILVEQIDSLSDHIDDARVVTEVLVGEAESEPMDVSSILEDVIETARESFPEATVEEDLPDTLPAEGTLALRPVFVNLIDNAVAHTPDDVHVRVTGRREDDTVSVTVADDGPGIPPAERERIFERGITSDGGDGGLGLHIVDTILDRMDGDIHVEDSDLGGAAFVVELPAVSKRELEAANF